MRRSFALRRSAARSAGLCGVTPLFRTTVAAALLALPGCGPAPPARAAPADATPAGIGINLGVVSSIYQEIPFVDVFRETQPWRIARHAVPNRDPPIDQSVIGPDGWIRSLATNEHAVACAFEGAHGRYPGGVYTLTYKGRGLLQIAGAGHIIGRGSGVIRVQVTPKPDQGICVTEWTTDPRDPIRDIHFVMPGFESTYQTHPFYPPFLAALRPFPVIRLIGWAQANKSDVVEWSDRRTPDYATQAWSYDAKTAPITRRGVALEYQIALANTLDADPWFNIPTRASDDYIRQMAELVHKTLRPDLHPIIEFSNEIWNCGFPDCKYAEAQGMAMGLDPGADPRTTHAHFYWYALRASRMFDIWNEVWGADSKRVVHMIAGQEGWPKEADLILGYHDTWKKADALAVGAYEVPFKLSPKSDQDTLDQISHMSADQVLDELGERVSSSLLPLLVKHAEVARKYGLSLAIYEGGPALATTMIIGPHKGAITDLLLAARRDPAMERTYQSLLKGASNSGVRLFMHFEDVEWPSSWGSFGALEYQDQDPATSPVYRALTSSQWGRKPTP